MATTATYGPLKCVVKQASKKHTATVIWAHGLGDTSAGWSFLPSELPHMDGYVKFIFPTAPVQRVTVNMGMPMTSWYDIKALGDDAERAGAQDQHDTAGQQKSIDLINAIVAKELETTSVPIERFVIGGFSQGSVIALMNGITSQKKLAGIAALSGYLPWTEALRSNLTATGKSIPYFMGHGESDPVVLFSWSQRSKMHLENDVQLDSLEYHSYRGLGHSVAPQELKHLADWFKKVLPEI